MKRESDMFLMCESDIACARKMAVSLVSLRKLDRVCCKTLSLSVATCT